MNLPNKLSLMRMCLVPLLVIVYLFPYEQMGIEVGAFIVDDISLSYVNVACLVIFAVASFTDFLDGNIARKRGLITSFGKFIDPIADKLLVNTCLILLACFNEVPLVAVLIMIWRDTIVDAVRMMASGKGRVMAAGMLGKVKTVVQMFAIIFCFLNNLPFALWGIPMDQIFIWLACGVSIVSGIQYFMQAKDIVMESM